MMFQHLLEPLDAEILETLRTATGTWATIDVEAETAIHTEAVKLLNRAGLIETRHQFEITNNERPERLRGTFCQTGMVDASRWWEPLKPSFPASWQDGHGGALTAWAHAVAYRATSSGTAWQQRLYATGAQSHPELLDIVHGRGGFADLAYHRQATAPIRYERCEAVPAEKERNDSLERFKAEDVANVRTAVAAVGIDASPKAVNTALRKSRGNGLRNETLNGILNCLHASGEYRGKREYSRNDSRKTKP